MKRKQIAAVITAMTIVLGITAYGAGSVSAEQKNKEQTAIESTLNISNNDEITWSYDSQSDSWTMSVTCAVANPELPDYQGVSVNVPGAYVKGIDTDGDGTPDKMQVQEAEGQMEMVRMEMKCQEKSRTEYRMEMIQMEKSRMEHRTEVCQVEQLRTAMTRIIWSQVEWVTK